MMYTCTFEGGGLKISTRKQVAHLARVSEATVSRVLNNVGPIKEETKLRVLKAAKELNYYPNTIAKNFALNRSGNIGVVLPFMPNIRIFSTYYFSEILSGIGVEVKAQGYDLLLLFRQPSEVLNYSVFFKTRKIDGCIILGSKDISEEIQALNELAGNGYPYCLVNQHYDGMSFNEIDADHISGSYMAVKHLIDQGFRKISILNGPQEYSNSRDRFEGYSRALSEAGISIQNNHIFSGNYSRKSGFMTAEKIVPHIEDIDAIFAANDRMAIGLIQGLERVGIVAGRDIAIVGYDNSDASTLSVPTLTSVHVPFYEMGKKAALSVIKQLQGVEGNHQIKEMLSTELIIRNSSKIKANN